MNFFKLGAAIFFNGLVQLNLSSHDPCRFDPITPKNQSTTPLSCVFKGFREPEHRQLQSWIQLVALLKSHLRKWLSFHQGLHPETKVMPIPSESIQSESGRDREVVVQGLLRSQYGERKNSSVPQVLDKTKSSPHHKMGNFNTKLPDKT